MKTKKNTTITNRPYIAKYRCVDGPSDTFKGCGYEFESFPCIQEGCQNLIKGKKCDNFYFLWLNYKEFENYWSKIPTNERERFLL